MNKIYMEGNSKCVYKMCVKFLEGLHGSLETQGSSGMANTEDLFKRNNFIASLKVPGRKKKTFSASPERF